MVGTVVGGLIGLCIIFLFPNILSIEADYSALVREKSSLPSYSLKSGAPLVPVLLPLLFSLVGAILSFIVHKSLYRVK